MSSLPAVEQLEIVGSSWNGISNIFPTLFSGCAYRSGGFFYQIKHDEQNYLHRFTVGLDLQTKATTSLPLPSCPFALPPVETSLARCRYGQRDDLADHGQNCPWTGLAFLADVSSVPGSFSCYPRFQLSRLEEISQNQDLLSELCPVHFIVIPDIFREEEARKVRLIIASNSLWKVNVKGNCFFPKDSSKGERLPLLCLAALSLTGHAVLMLGSISTALQSLGHLHRGPKPLALSLEIKADGSIATCQSEFLKE